MQHIVSEPTDHTEGHTTPDPRLSETEMNRDPNGNHNTNCTRARLSNRECKDHIPNKGTNGTEPIQGYPLDLDLWGSEQTSTKLLRKLYGTHRRGICI
jgi:hypothetical protein